MTDNSSLPKSRKVRTAILLVGAFLNLFVLSEQASACTDFIQSGPSYVPGNIYRLPMRSDESGEGNDECPRKCPAHFALMDIECNGRYCDNLYPVCARFEPNGVIGGKGRGYWTNWFSEELDNKTTTRMGSTWPNLYDQNSIATGVECRGSYCDEMRLYMLPIRPDGMDARQVTMTATGAPRCTLSQTTVSDENAGSHRIAAPGNFIRRVGCSGKYCDNMRFEYCSLTQVTQPAVGAQAFEWPNGQNGWPVDYCLRQGDMSSCGRPAADAYCRSKLFAGSTVYVPPSGSPYVMSTRTIRPNGTGCVGQCWTFKRIVCRR